MVSWKQWVIINICLVFVFLLLLLNFYGVKLPSFGHAQYIIQKGEPSCAIEWQAQLTEWNDIDRCCLEARQQLSCKKEKYSTPDKNYDRTCQTGNSNKVIKILLNDKAYYYCRLEPFWFN
ncbi:hypothetical protein HYU21_04945 [Candidatus Woesearchaeota archaeon]|nr:hypothetical protein [Candidatus Woesearchaeota archaeon]